LVWSWLVVMLFSMLFAATVRAQDNGPIQVSDNDVNAIAKQLFCPVCENIPLDVCPTQACAEWREDIREKLGQGWTEAQIKQYFADRYGDRVLGAPPARGLNWMVYILPPLIILLGGFFLVRSMVLWKNRTAEGERVISDDRVQTDSDQVQPSAGDEYVQRLEDELKKR
jgi:cytochrome c-type biogenesis protein CcmH